MRDHVYWAVAGSQFLCHIILIFFVPFLSWKSKLHIQATLRYSYFCILAACVLPVGWSMDEAVVYGLIFPTLLLFSRHP